MANPQNLRPLPSFSSHEQAIRGRKGGKSRSPAKKIAARLRDLKKKGLTDETAKQLYQIMIDNNMSALDILTRIQAMQKTCKKPSEHAAMNKLLIDWHKMHHGVKVKTENVHHVIDWASIIQNCEIRE